MPPSRQSSLNSGGGGSGPSGSAQPAGHGGLMRASSLGAGSGGGAATAGSAATGQPSSGVTTAVDRGPSISPASMEAHIFGGNPGSRGPPQATMSFVNSFVNRPGSANAVNRRRSEQHFASPVEPSSSTQHHTPYSASNAAAQQYHHQHYGQHHPHANVFEEEGPRSASAMDDEDHKGHGLGRRSSMGFASSSGRWTPTILTNMLRRAGEGRFSPVGQSHSSSANQHASPSSPHHRFFSPHSPRMKVLSTEPEEIQSHEHLSHDSAAGKSQGRTRSSFIEQPSSGTRLGLVVERPLDEKQQSRLLGSAIQDGDDVYEKKKTKDSPRQQQEGKSHSGSEVDHRSSGGAGTAAYYAPQSTLTTTGAHTPVQGRTSLQQHHSHAHKLSTSSTAASSHSIQMHSPQMHTHSRHTSLQSVRNAHRPQQSPILAPANSSPLVVPQARRGAVNLRKSNRRRKISAAAKRQRAAMNAVPMHVKIFRLIGLLFWTICHPISAVNRAIQSISTSLHNIDMAFRDPRTGARDWNPKWLGAYIPLLIWLGVSLSSTFTVLIWHTQVFQALDRLSAYLQSLGLLGRLIFGALIFLTTFPPLPLYSTLIILCGFSFGLWQGFIISYIAALSGAIVVFLMSRSLLKKWMVGLLNQSGGLKKVVRAIERRPKLLFLVRLAPYPYNLMNTLLASSPTLTLKTYTICTALALPKLLVHCGLGTTIKNFAAYNGAAVPEAPIGQGGAADGPEGNGAAPMIGSDSQWADQSKASETAELVKHVAGFVGVGLCIGIFFYLYSVARKAVDEELDGDELAADEYELVSSDEAEDDDASSVDGLDDDHLNISNGNLLGSRHGSSESMRIGDDLSLSQRSSSQNGRDAVLSPSIIRPNGYAQGTSLMTDSRSASGLSSMISQKSALAVEGATPLYIAQSNGSDGAYNNGGGASAAAGATGNASYFGAWSGKNGSTNHRAPGRNDYPRIYMDSRASLADSIVEMEKHADLLEADGGQHDVICEYGDATPRHDISIELSPPPLGRRGKSAAATNSAGMYDKAAGSAAESKASLLSGFSNAGERRGSSGDDGGSVDDRRRLMEVDRNRASRRSQMGYEEENVVGAR